MLRRAPVAIKTCSRCKEEKPLDAFSAAKRYRDGLTSACKDCGRLRSLEWRTVNPEKNRGYQAVYRKAHPEKGRAHQAVWYQKHSEQACLKGAVYRQANPEAVRLTQEAYRKANPEKLSAKNNERMGRLRNVQSERVLISVLFERDKGLCGICQHPVVKYARDPFMRPSHDHILPVSLGGANTYANSRLVHRRCNSVRGNKGPAQLRMLG